MTNTTTQLHTTLPWHFKQDPRTGDCAILDENSHIVGEFFADIRFTHEGAREEAKANAAYVTYVANTFTYHTAALEAVKVENHGLYKELMIAEQGYGEDRLRYHCEQAIKRAEKAETALEAAKAMVLEQHPDDIAVDRFADAMKAKMASSRAKGRSGWNDPAECPIDYLAHLLVKQIQERPVLDPVDIGNFAMMIFNRPGEQPDRGR